MCNEYKKLPPISSGIYTDLLALTRCQQNVFLPKQKSKARNGAKKIDFNRLVFVPMSKCLLYVSLYISLMYNIQIKNAKHDKLEIFRRTMAKRLFFWIYIERTWRMFIK